MAARPRRKEPPSRVGLHGAEGMVQHLRARVRRSLCPGAAWRARLQGHELGHWPPSLGPWPLRTPRPRRSTRTSGPVAQDPLSRRAPGLREGPNPPGGRRLSPRSSEDLTARSACRPMVSGPRGGPGSSRCPALSPEVAIFFAAWVPGRLDDFPGAGFSPLGRLLTAPGPGNGPRRANTLKNRRDGPRHPMS